jgi:type II secretory pathway pseudopilin PulG
VRVGCRTSGLSLATDPASREGFALAAALLCVMLIAALMASVFFAAMEETRIAAVSSARQVSLSAAETAIEQAIRDWPATPADPIGVDGTRSYAIDASGTAVSVTVTRLDSTIYWIVADAGRVPSGLIATRRIGVVVRARIGPDGSIAVDRMPERWWSELF